MLDERPKSMFTARRKLLLVLGLLVVTPVTYFTRMRDDFLELSTFQIVSHYRFWGLIPVRIRFDTPWSACAAESPSANSEAPLVNFSRPFVKGRCTWGPLPGIIRELEWHFDETDLSPDERQRIRAECIAAIRTRGVPELLHADGSDAILLTFRDGHNVRIPGADGAAKFVPAIP